MDINVIRLYNSWQQAKNQSELKKWQEEKLLK